MWLQNSSFIQVINKVKSTKLQFLIFFHLKKINKNKNNHVFYNVCDCFYACEIFILVRGQLLQTVEAQILLGCIQVNRKRKVKVW